MCASRVRTSTITPSSRRPALRGEMVEVAAVPRLVVGGADAGIAAARREPWPCLGRARPPKHEQHAGDVKSEQNDARLQRARGRGARAGERGRLIAVVHGQGAHQGQREGLRRRRRQPPRRGTRPRRPHQQRDDVVVLDARRTFRHQLRWHGVGACQCWGAGGRALLGRSYQGRCLRPPGGLARSGRWLGGYANTEHTAPRRGRKGC